MFRYSLLLFCTVGVGLAEWVDPDWGFWKGKNPVNNKYPPLPGSVLLNNYNDVNAIEKLARPTGITTTPPITTKASKSTTTKASKSTTTTSKPSTCTSIYSCADCHTAQVCRPTVNGGWQQVFKLPCPTSRPFCDYTTGTCSSVPDSRCGSADTFMCTDNGYFPDPTNCSIYHVCNNYQSQMFSCVNGNSYDADKTECNSSPCLSTNCEGVSQYKVGLGNSHYYTYCSSGSPFLVSRCQGHYKLNATSQVCEAICIEDGLMADLDDCTQYYKCSSVYINNAFPAVIVRESLPCPNGEAFEPSSYQCIPQALSTCKSKSS